MTITGYDYNTETYCRDCMWDIVTTWADLPQPLRREMKNETTEGALDIAARFWNINRHDEHTFDSGDFPKVVFESQTCQEDCGHDACATCHARLCEQ